MFRFTGRDLRLIVCRQPTTRSDQLAFDDLDGWRFYAIVTNIPPIFGSRTSPARPDGCAVLAVVTKRQDLVPGSPAAGTTTAAGERPGT